jgi:hypothetical protein
MSWNGCGDFGRQLDVARDRRGIGGTRGIAALKIVELGLEATQGLRELFRRESIVHGVGCRSDEEFEVTQAGKLKSEEIFWPLFLPFL